MEKGEPQIDLVSSGMWMSETDGGFPEINVPAGPSGELRYPSYNAHDQGSGYPTRGALQSLLPPGRPGLPEHDAEEIIRQPGRHQRRVGEVASGTGQARYSAFIREFSTKGFPSLYVRGTSNAWGTTAMGKTGTVWSVPNIHFGSTGSERI
jgi:hypothetical protein